MDFMELACNRFSVRSFSERPVEQEKLDLILEAGRIAPTATNKQPQRVYVLKSEEALAKINKLSHSIFGATTVLVVAYDEDKEWTNRYQEGIHSGVEDASIVACHMMMAAWELGVGSLWVNAFANAEVERELGLPASERVVLLMPLGYAADGCEPSKWHASRKPLDETVQYL